MLVALAVIGLCALALVLFESTPTGFVPPEDQGYVMVLAKLPSGATIQATEALVDQANQLIMNTPGVSDVIAVPGFDLIDSIQDPSSAFMFVMFKPYDERKTPETQLDGIMAHIQAGVATIPGAEILVANAPPIPGLGSTGGFNFEIQDLNSLGVEALNKVLENFLAEAHKRPELAGVYSTFDAEVPQRFLEVDRVKAKTRGVSLNDIFDTLQINLGSLYVNQYNQYGRVYRVYLQAEKDARFTEDDITRLQVRNSEGKMIPLSAFVSIRPMVGPYNIPPLQRVRLGSGQRRPGTGIQLRTSQCGHGGARCRGPPGRVRLRMDQPGVPAEGGGQSSPGGVCHVAPLRVPGPRRAV